MQPGFVYRALTKSKTPDDKAFRLRENEQFLSVATSIEKALGQLRCKGWAKLDVSKVEAMGLQVRPKTIGQSDPPDLDLLEIVGIPLFSDPSEDRTNVAIGLVATVCEYGAIEVRPRENTDP